MFGVVVVVRSGVCVWHMGVDVRLLISFVIRRGKILAVSFRLPLFTYV